MNTFKTITPATSLEQQLAQALAENARLKAAQPKPKSLGMKVSAKGALSVYGLGRFPVTLYAEQWLRLIAIANDITAFINANKSTLTSK